MVANHTTLALLFLLPMLSLASPGKTPQKPNPKSSPPIACNVAALTPAERHRHAELIQHLFKSKSTVREIPAGYEVRFTGAREIWPVASEWVGLESRCCPFIDLSIAMSAKQDSVTLRLTGTAAVKAFLKEEFTQMLK